MSMGVPNQGLKKPFAFERQRDNVLRSKAFEKFTKCFVDSQSYNSCK
jgi:hypothetical protein